MKKLKWILTFAALALLAAVTINGTLANTVTPEPEIEQIVMQRNGQGTELTDFQDGSMLLPSRYDTVSTASQELVWGESKAVYTLWDDSVENEVDYFVFVKNVCPSAENTEGSYRGEAYVRTWFAFEQGDLTEEEVRSVLLLNQNHNDWEWETISYGVEIGDNSYMIFRATYKEVLLAGEITVPSLLQVMLSKDTTTKQAERLDGDKDGEYDILIYTQAVSDENAWSGAFGNDHPWQN